MSGLQRVPHKSVAAPSHIDLLTPGVSRSSPGNLFSAFTQALYKPRRNDRSKNRELLHGGIAIWRLSAAGGNQSARKGAQRQRAPFGAPDARSRKHGRRRIRAKASEGSGARSGPEDEVTLGDRLNAISHRKPLPGVNGTAAHSRGLGAAAAAEPSDPSVSHSPFQGRSLPEPLRPPAVVKVSNRHDVVGVLGGISPCATADFMRQIIQATPARANQDHVPLLVSSVPQIPSLSAPILNRPAGPELDQAVVSPLPDLLKTRTFLEQAGARCIVMPSNMAHFWYDQLALDCSVPFLHIVDAVVEELDMAKLEPLEVGSRPKVGLLAGEATLKARIYQQKLEARGYTVVVPDRDTLAHAVLPGLDALERGDSEGAKNLLGIGIQMLLVNAVNVVILAFSEASSVFPPSDPILKRCLSPTAALARATVRWVLKTRGDGKL